MGSISKPLGGITTLTLGVASLYGAAPTLPEGGVSIPLLEDRSTYAETISWIGALKSVKHTLRFYTSLNYELPEELSDAFSRGFVALIALNSGDSVSVGWSEEALSNRALRLVSCSVSSGERPASRGYKEWLLESTDSISNI